MKQVLALLLIVVVAVLLALFLTFLLSPLWRWIESVSGIESMGHSGPANWCFVAVLMGVLPCIWATWFRVGRRKR
jgi:hypothetical protein